MREGHGGVLYASKLQHQGTKEVFQSFLHNLIVYPSLSHSVPSKTALLEGLEVDQYMWGILNAIQKYVQVKNHN